MLPADSLQWRPFQWFLIVLGVHGFHPSSKGFDMLHSNYKRYLSKHLSRKLSRTLSRKIKESLSQASQRFAATTLRAETLQLMQRTSFCHGSHSCAWGGQEMNQFPGLVAEDGCSESVAILAQVTRLAVAEILLLFRRRGASTCYGPSHSCRSQISLPLPPFDPNRDQVAELHPCPQPLGHPWLASSSGFCVGLP